MDNKRNGFKTFVVGALLGIVLTASAWFAIGRIETADIRISIEGTDRDLARTEQSGDNFGRDFNRYTGKMAILSTESGGLWTEIGDIRGDFQREVRERRIEYGSIQSEFQFFSTGINSVENAVRRIVGIAGEYADILYEYRRLAEANGPPD